MDQQLIEDKELLKKPNWIKIRPPHGEKYQTIKKLMRELKLSTVCEEALCPNVSECWGAGTATIMLMGDICTRACKFCHVKSGKLNGELDREEPKKVAYAIKQLGLSYVVLTSVDRDDIKDGGASHFGETVKAIKISSPDTLVEVLIPDFVGDRNAIRTILESKPDVLAHNIETVPRLSPTVRDRRCVYQTSLDVLAFAKKEGGVYTKSSIMLGLGETKEEVLSAMQDLRNHAVDIVTLGQYLRPSSWHLPVKRFVPPDEFKEFEAEGLNMGFLSVPSGPLIRSSYRASEKFLEGMIRKSQSLSQ